MSTASTSRVLSAFTVRMAYVSRASAQDELMAKPRNWDLVRPLCSAGSSPKTSRSPADFSTSAGRPALSLLLLLALLVRLSSLLLLLLLPSMSPKLALPR